jgi:hypothetical protein
MAGQYNPYAAGKKTYGGGRPMPTVGPVDPIGYKERDASNAINAKQNINDRNAVLKRLKNNQKGNYFPTDAQKGV